jgi:hypothetical protein
MLLWHSVACAACFLHKFSLITLPFICAWNIALFLKQIDAGEDALVVVGAGRESIKRARLERSNTQVCIFLYLKKSSLRLISPLFEGTSVNARICLFPQDVVGQKNLSCCGHTQWHLRVGATCA